MIFEFIAFFILLFIIIGLVYQFMFDIYYTTLIISTLFYLSYITLKLVFHFKRKQTTTEEQLPKVEKTELSIVLDKDIQILKEFMTKNLNEGFKLKVIKEALIKQGWPSTKVEQAALEVSK